MGCWPRSAAGGDPSLPLALAGTTTRMFLYAQHFSRCLGSLWRLGHVPSQKLENPPREVGGTVVATPGTSRV
jgi:hypothetical protein